MKSLLFSLAAASFAALGATAQVTTMATDAVGFIVHPLPATAAVATDYLSVPLSQTRVFSGAASSFTSNTLTVDGAGWTAGQFGPAHVRFTSGAEAGRTLAVLSNTDSQLTVDVTDDSAQSTPLDTAGFAVAAGDAFEIVPDDTLGALLTANSSTLVGGPDLSTADGIGLWNESLGAFEPYYFNTTAGHWVKDGDATQADYTNLSIPPGAAVAITRPAGRPAGQIILAGAPPSVAPLLKLPGGNEVRYYGSLLPIDVVLAQLDLGAYWKKSNNSAKADILSLVKPGTSKFKNYVERKDGTWLKAGHTADKSRTDVPASSGVAFLKHKDATGVASFIQIPLPYQP